MWSQDEPTARRSGRSKAGRHVLILAMALMWSPAMVSGWYCDGHRLATELAIDAAEGQFPDFFVAQRELMAHCACDPDLFKQRPFSQARAQEYPEHYIDLELLGATPLPATREGFIGLCARKGLAPKKVGFVPYAVAEWTQKLALVFAEHRKWPDNASIRHKCGVYAGVLAHYAADLCQPLHTTIHYNGRAGKDGSSPRTGIHQKVDALLGKVKESAVVVPDSVQPVADKDLMKGVLAELAASHALVDSVYAIEDVLPTEQQSFEKHPRAARFAKERLRASVEFLAGLYLWAWRISEEITLPEWHER